MPIRMVPDEDGQDPRRQQPRRKRPNTGGGGGGGIGSLLGPLLGILFKKPKLMLLIAVGFGIYYFMGNGCNPGGGGIVNDIASKFLTGADLSDRAGYENVAIFEPLADNRKNPLPERISLQDHAPQRLNQGQQGSCVGWASAYAARSIMHAREHNIDPRQASFSPAFLYNQIKLNSQCQGAYIHQAMENMLNKGSAPYSEFRYDPSTCSTQIPDQVWQSAYNNRTKGYQRFTNSEDDQKVDMLAMKQNLAQGAPVVIGMMVGGTFMQDMQGQDMWYPSERDYSMPGYGGHAMCVIGYDDYKFGNNMGGFQIMNSWGPEWGKNGLGWVSYQDMDYFTREAYGLYPMGNGLDKAATEFDVRFGLVNNDTKQNIVLSQAGGKVFRTQSPIAKGTKFKVEVTNNNECYVYLFGKESDGTAYTLFPYTPKHSPYCGITGTRLFPRDYSLQADELGNQDEMAIVVTNNPVDYEQFTTMLSKGSVSNGFAKALDDVLAALNLSPSSLIQYYSGETIGAKAKAKQNGAIAFVIQVDKQ